MYFPVWIIKFLILIDNSKILIKIVWYHTNIVVYPNKIKSQMQRLNELQLVLEKKNIKGPENIKNK